MRMRPQHYYFGRLNIITAYHDKTPLILKGLYTEKLLDINDFFWGLFDINIFAHKKYGDFFTGYLTKYKPFTEEEIADEIHHHISLENASKRIAAKSRFFLHVDSGLIAYHQVKNKIKSTQFQDNFCKLIQIAHDNFFVNAEIQTIEEQFEILKAIEQFDRISKVSLYLHPSNPHSGIWKNIDDRLKNINASSYKEEYSNKQGQTLNITNDDEIRNKIIMAVDGYGKADISGIIGGEERTVHTTDNPVISISNHKDDEYSDVFNDIKNTFASILQRFGHKLNGVDGFEPLAT